MSQVFAVVRQVEMDNGNRVQSVLKAWSQKDLADKMAGELTAHAGALMSSVLVSHGPDGQPRKVGHGGDIGVAFGIAAVQFVVRVMEVGETALVVPPPRNLIVPG